MIYSSKQIEEFKQLLIDKKEIIRQFNIDENILNGWAVNVKGTVNKRFEFSTFSLMNEFLTIITENVTI